jgi:NAD(P)-dependent dehydrogenase (short-subunit alcohol dehydrogenase family)
MHMDIAGKGVVITGASEGLGAALGRRLASAGAKVVLFARRAAPLEALADEIREAGGQAWAVTGDIADKEAIYPLAATASELTGGVEVLVHNASTLGPTPLRLLLDTDCEDLERVLQVNLVGPFRLSKALAAGMALRGRGLVLSVSSDAAVEAYPRWGAYGLSKAALDHLGRTFAAELADTGVRFLSVDPGEMDTAMHAAAMPEADRNSLLRPAEVAEQIAAMITQVERLPSGSRVQAARFGARS